jgi:hypothetical protein
VLVVLHCNIKTYKCRQVYQKINYSTLLYGVWNAIPMFIANFLINSIRFLYSFYYLLSFYLSESPSFYHVGTRGIHKYIRTNLLNENYLVDTIRKRPGTTMVTINPDEYRQAKIDFVSNLSGSGKSDLLIVFAAAGV